MTISGTTETTVLSGTTELSTVSASTVSQSPWNLIYEYGFSEDTYGFDSYSYGYFEHTWVDGEVTSE